MHSSTYIILAASAIIVLLLRFLKSFRAKNSSDHPPGPIQIPLLGRIHDLPIKFMWLKFYEWSQIHGKETGFYRTEMLGAKFIVVSDEKVAEDLLVKRAKYNSDRPLVKSLFDSKSTDGGMAYLPLMGKNRELIMFGPNRGCKM
jgi:hypothetical protein